VRVWGGDAIAHVSPAGATTLTQDFKKGIGIDVTPTLDPKGARAAVHKVLNPKGAYVKDPDVELVVYPVTKEVAKSQRVRGPQGELNAAHRPRMPRDRPQQPMLITVRPKHTTTSSTFTVVMVSTVPGGQPTTACTLAMDTTMRSGTAVAFA
jgi:hypothetical protein